MGEDLIDLIKKLSDILFWIGRHSEGNVMVYLVRLLQAEKIETEEQFGRYVEHIESKEA